MPPHFHWFTSIALALAEILTYLTLRHHRRVSVFRCYLLAVALRSLFPYARFADSPILDGGILLLRIAIVAEFLFEISWKTIEQKYWMLVGAGCFQFVALLALFDFQVQPDAWHPDFVLVRQLTHVELLVAALTALLWFWYYDVRHSRFSTIHGWLLMAYLLDYSAAGFWIALRPESRCAALATFDLTAMALLAIWTVAARACGAPPQPATSGVWPPRKQVHIPALPPPS